jgi:hypothetical protein
MLLLCESCICMAVCILLTACNVINDIMATESTSCPRVAVMPSAHELISNSCYDLVNALS